jgi:DNA-binding protein H-NS
MGRTQPSLTRIIELELEKLDKIANKLRDEELAEIIKEAKENVRKIEEAVQDELVDPLEVILIAFLVSNRLRNRRNT